MVNIFRIIIENRNTFYDNRTNETLRVWPRLLVFGLLSFVASWFLMLPIGEFLNAINTVISILLGFSFSVLFFLASHQRVEALNKDSLEQENKIRRINRLSREIFYNVSYFLTVSMLVLALSIIILLPDFWVRFLHLCKAVGGRCEGGYLQTTFFYVSLLSRVTFSFLIIESAFTFLRLIIRVSFMFEERLSLSSERVE